jgi:hypothetical protein
MHSLRSLIFNESCINLDLKTEVIRANIVVGSKKPGSRESLFLAVPFKGGNLDLLTALLKDPP